MRRPARRHQRHLLASTPKTAAVAPLYNRLDLDAPGADAVFALAGDRVPASEQEAYDLQDYLLECVLQTDDPVTRNTALVALAHEAQHCGNADLPLASGPMFPYGPWIVTQDGDPDALALFNRHYSAKPHRRARRFVGPGNRIVLKTAAGDALFVWRIARHRADGQWGAECTVFRNESSMLSSSLIRWAELVAVQRWPLLVRAFTYVNARKIRSTNPGYTFQCAGWQLTPYASSRGLRMLEKLFLPDRLLDTPWLLPPERGQNA